MFNKWTGRAVAIFVGLLAVLYLFSNPAKAELILAVEKACVSVQDKTDELNGIAEKGDFEHELTVYEGERANNLKTFLESKLGPMRDFDAVILGRRDNYPAAYLAFFDKGCLLVEGAIPVNEYFTLKTIGDGV